MLRRQGVDAQHLLALFVQHARHLRVSVRERLDRLAQAEDERPARGARQGEHPQADRVHAGAELPQTKLRSLEPANELRVVREELNKGPSRPYAS